MELGKAGYVAQLAAYIKNEEYNKAYNLAKLFIQRFPQDMIAHFLFSESAFWLGRYEESALEGRIAFNKSETNEDMLECAILTSSAYFELGRYPEGFHLLKLMEKRQKSEELEKLLVIFSLQMRDEREAEKHMDELYRINRNAAEDLMSKYLQD